MSFVVTLPICYALSSNSTFFWSRGYEKSIIEKEISDQRAEQEALWHQTKEGILDAREMIKISNYAQGGGRRKYKEIINSKIGKFLSDVGEYDSHTESENTSEDEFFLV